MPQTDNKRTQCTHFSAYAASFFCLLALKTHAVGALIDRGGCFVRADMDAVKRAVFGAAAVVCALFNRTVNCGVAMVLVHEQDLLLRFPA